jgi:uncharacterized protein
LTLYFDSSAVVARYFIESHTASISQALSQTTLFCTNQATCAETRAAFSQLKHQKRLVGKRYYEALAQFEKDWEDFDRRNITDALVRWAGALAETYILKGYDSVHLASALIFQQLYSDVQFLSYDVRLNRAASSAGLVLWT